LTRTSQQQRQDLEGLLLKAKGPSILPEFASLKIKFKLSEVDALPRLGGKWHLTFSQQ
jgi:hypothetical protein